MARISFVLLFMQCLFSLSLPESGERKISTINIEYDVDQIKQNSSDDFGVDSRNSIGKESNQYEDGNEFPLRKISPPKKSLLIKPDQSPASKNGPFQFHQNDMLNPIRKDKERVYSTVTFDLSVSIHEMNNRYKKGIKESKPIHRRRPTFKRLNASGFGSFYGNWKRRSRVRKTSTEIRKDMFSKKADKTIHYSRLCIAIAISFFVLTMPGNLLSISFANKQEAFSFVQKSEVFVSITNFLEVINYSGNFILYCFTNTVIRRAAKNDIRYFINFLLSPIRAFRSILSNSIY